MSQRKAVVGPKLRKVLALVFFLFACLTANSIYLAAISAVEYFAQTSLQGITYQWMFLAHLVLGLIIILPTLVYGFIHMSNALGHRNQRAVKAGLGLFASVLILLISGLALTRGMPLIELRSPSAREVAYWAHVVTPLIVVWLYVLHRLAGRRIRWRAGALVSLIAVVITLGGLLPSLFSETSESETLAVKQQERFFPSLAKTVDGDYLDAIQMMNDAYCAECHQDVHDDWAHSAHRFSSFNNPAYRFSVMKTRDFVHARDGNTKGVRFCAGCHDPVPFFAGKMDDVNFGNANEPSSQAGITCTVCHSITSVDSPKGNADYTISAPTHYPFMDSDSEWLQWVNRTLVKAKPNFHKQTFLKPVHKTTEFCGSCHKVHLPKELNAYKWLRGQNHYDSFLLSGVSGHGIKSFYYPESAKSNCNSCHMPLQASNDFGAKDNQKNGSLSIHDHTFAASNVAIPHLLGFGQEVADKHNEIIEGSLRVDLFGIREGELVDAPLRIVSQGKIPALKPGGKYLLEMVLRTMTLGHHFTQGTADSNQVWVNVRASSNKELIGQSGQFVDAAKQVDSYAHFVNAYVIDRDGNRIDRRNPENIFTQLYNNQIPPGAADVIHYAIEVPETAKASIEVEVELNYRKFDTQYLRMFTDDPSRKNDLPIIKIARQKIVFPVEQQSDDHSTRQISHQSTAAIESSINVPTWQRWNDYGIGLFRRGQYRQAERAFSESAALGYGLGELNLARVYLAEGRLDEASEALVRARNADKPAYLWSIEYFTAQINLQNGFFDEAIAALRGLVATEYSDARARGFDFSKDYRLLNELASALAERAKLERGPARANNAIVFRREAVQWHQQALLLDPENVAAHYGLTQLYAQLEEPELADQHRKLHQIYKVDDNAKDRAVQLARAKNPAADLAANQIVIYDLNRQSK